MDWVLFHRNQQGRPDILRRYSSRKGALIGMRASNRNAGWSRISLCHGGIVDMEWAARSNGLPVYDYAPYVIAPEYHFNQRYPLFQCSVDATD
jgi:hypothetical protein